MTYTEVYNAVVGLTARPDLVTETKLAIQAATLRAHNSDYYTRDMQEGMLVFPAYQYSQQIEVTQALGKFRNLKYVRKYDPSGVNPQTGLATGLAGELFQILDPEDVFDSYGLEKENIATLAGNYLSLKSSTGTFAYAIAGWYTNPTISPLTDADYRSWIAVDYPFAIIYEAAGVVFKTIGRDTENTVYSRMSAEQIAMIRMTAVTAHAG